MSEDVVQEKGLHILLGVSALSSEQIKMFKEAFSKRGKEIAICAEKYSKLAIEQYITEHKDVSILIVSEFIQQSSAYTISDLEKLCDINNNVVIVPILGDKRKGTSFVNELLSLGIYTAMFEQDASIQNIVDMVFDSRTRTEAKAYYEINNAKDISETANIRTCIDHIMFGGEKDKTKDRADYVRNKLSEKDFEEVIAGLPKDIKDRLSTFDDYTQYFEDVTTQSKEKKGLLSNGLKKTINTVSSMGGFLNKELGEEMIIPSVVTQEVQSAVKMVAIGFAGTQPRVGTTHQTILFGNYLSAAGYKIAIVENITSESKSFLSIESRYDVKSKGEFFTYHDIDYYPNFNLSELNKIYLKNYNFVLIDFGMYNETIAMEFGRCVVQIIVTGSKPWETPMLERLIMLVNDEEVLKKFNYLFMCTPDDEHKVIIKNMAELNKVFFATYQTDPFVNEGYQAIKEILDDYLPKGELIHRKGQRFGKLLKLFE